MRIKDGDRLILLGDEEEGLALVKADVFQERTKAIPQVANRRRFKMKKKMTFAVILSLCFIMFCGCSKASISSISVDYGKSEIYSQKDMDSAIDVIEKEFSSWEGCELHSISYVSDKISKDNVGYCNELQTDAGYDECIVFESAFHSPKNGGGAWTADEECTGWNWYLARKDNGAWTLLTNGYA